MAEYTLEREYKIRNNVKSETIRIRPGPDNGVIINHLIDGNSYCIEEANAIAHAILHCIADIQHFQAGIEEKLRPERVADRDGWIEHDGKGIPVPEHIMVEVEFRDGDKAACHYAGAWHHALNLNSNWIHSNDSADIVRYRVVPQ